MLQSADIIIGKCHPTSIVSTRQQPTMAVCVRVEASVDGVMRALATCDAFNKAVTAISNDEYNDEGSVVAMGPGDDFFLAPFAHVPVPMRRRRGEETPEKAHWLMFTCYKTRRAHDEALSMLVKTTMPSTTVVSSVGDVEEGALGRKCPISKWTRFRQSPWRMGADVCTQLEDFAVVETFRALGLGSPPEDWRARRAAHVAAMTAGTPAADVPLAELPEWGDSPFRPLTKAEERAAAADYARRVAQEAADKEAQRAEVRRSADAERAKRYAPTMERCKDATLPDDETDTACRFVFAVSFDGEAQDPPAPCVYDRKTGSPFCSMCAQMVARAAA